MSEEVALANANVAELAAAQATIDGQRRLIGQAVALLSARPETRAGQSLTEGVQTMLHALDQAQADAAVLRATVKQMSDLIGRAVRPPEIVSAAHELAADVLTQPHPGAELLAEQEQLRAVITRQVEQSATDHQALTEVRGALAVALAELDRTRPHVFALARLLGRCDYAFETILKYTNAHDAHRTARRMRAELAPKEPNEKVRD